MSVGSRLKQLINDKSVTPYHISVKTGVSQATISRILNNETAKLSIDTTEKLAKRLSHNGSKGRYIFKSCTRPQTIMLHPARDVNICAVIN